MVRRHPPRAVSVQTAARAEGIDTLIDAYPTVDVLVDAATRA